MLIATAILYTSFPPPCSQSTQGRSMRFLPNDNNNSIGKFSGLVSNAIAMKAVNMLDIAVALSLMSS